MRRQLEQRSLLVERHRNTPNSNTLKSKQKIFNSALNLKRRLNSLAPKTELQHSKRRRDLIGLEDRFLKF